MYLLGEHTPFAPGRLKEEDAAARVWILATADFFFTIEVPYWGN